MKPVNPAAPIIPSEVELIELAPGLTVTREFIDSYPKHELPHLVQGYMDMIEGRVVPHEEVMQILAEDAKQRGLESERAKSI